MARITRIEVIDENGRHYVNYEDDNDVIYQLQDDGRTLKVFVNTVKPKTPCEIAYKRIYGKYAVTGIAGGSGWTFFQDGYNASKAEEYQPTPQEPEDNEWKTVALRFGENLSAIGPCGYYDFTPEEWGEWAINAYEKTAEDWLSLLKKEKVKVEKMMNLLKQYKPSTPQERGERIHKEVENEIGKLQENNWYVDAKTLIKSNWEPTPQTENEVAEGLKEAFREAVNQGVIPKVKELNKEVDSMKENSPEFLKFELGPTLYDVIGDWWDNIFTVQSDDDLETSVEDLCDRIEKWLPKEQSANSQNAYVECTVEGFNDAITKIKNKIKNKLK